MSMHLRTGTGYIDDGSKTVSAKAWAFYHTTGTHSISNSIGFSGITDRGAGYCSLEFSTTQPNLNWSLGYAAGDNARLNIDGNATLTTAVHMISHTGGTNTGVDCHRNSVQVHGT